MIRGLFLGIALSFAFSLIVGNIWAQGAAPALDGTASAAPAISPPGPAAAPPKTPAEHLDEAAAKLDDAAKQMADAAKDDDDAATQMKADDDDKLGDDFTSGKLIRYGVTGGLAFTAIGRAQPDLQAQWAVTYMPYVGVFPFWWESMGRITRAYCAEQWLTVRDSDAQETANKLAEKIALAALRRKPTDPTDPTLQGPKAKLPARDASNFNQVVLDNSEWDEKERGRCPTLRSVGLYWGLPAKFNVNGKATSSDVVKARDYTPYSSFGVIFAPVAAFSFMIGATVSHVGDDTSMASVNQHVWSWNFGVGGNLDLAGALLK